MKRLQDKVCIVTGATSGIGRRTAQVFAAEGALLVVAGRREPEGAALARELGPRCDFLRTDVTQEDDVKAMIDFTVRKHGRIDCLFNNAGGPAPTGGIAGIPVDGFDAAMALLVRSVMLGMKHVAPIMVRQRSGSIINNGSIAGTRAGYSSSVIYSAAKAAVIQLSKCVAMELGEHGVRVNSLSPGAIATGIVAKALGLPVEEAEKKTAIIEQRYAGAQPIPRAGMPDDIARAALFLASDESSFVSAQDLVVDGGVIGGRGWTAQWEGLNGMRNALGLQD